MKNATELREKLGDTLDKIEAGEITAEKAMSISRLATTMVKTAKLQLDAAVGLNCKPKSSFYKFCDLEE